MSKADQKQLLDKLPPRPALPLANLKPIVFDLEALKDIETVMTKEWVVTNGIGGYAASTPLGLHARRQHALLTAWDASYPGSRVLLSHVDETIESPLEKWHLSGAVHPEGMQPEDTAHLVEFRLDPWPSFLYASEHVVLEKQIFLLPWENAVVLNYQLHAAEQPLQLVVSPYIAHRGARELAHFDPHLRPQTEVSDEHIWVHPYEGVQSLFFQHDADWVDTDFKWKEEVLYPQDVGVATKRRQKNPVQEAQWSFGKLHYVLKEGASCSLVVSTGRYGMADATFHRRRIENTHMLLAQTLKLKEAGPLSSRLAWSCESFLKQQFASPQAPKPKKAVPMYHTPGGKGMTRVLSGFYGDNISGREALLGLPGMTLVTGHYDLAKSILETSVSSLYEGLLPVKWSGDQQSPNYASADTSLWLFWAVWQYFKATRHKGFVSRRLMEPMTHILESYMRGTAFGIHMDDDGLIDLDDISVALSWDAPVNMRGRLSSAFRQYQRSGKLIEINGLWYNALLVMAELSDQCGLKQASAYRKLARVVQKSFAEVFVNRDGGFYDFVHGPKESTALRANMLIAASMPFSPMNTKAQALALDLAESALLTDVGIRTLASDDDLYIPLAEQIVDKVQAYQGSVWTWLWGPYVSTVCHVRGMRRPMQERLEQRLQHYVSDLEEGALGCVAQRFDAEVPHRAGGEVGSFSAAGELLRALSLARLLRM